MFTKMIGDKIWWLFLSLLGALSSGILDHHISKLTCLNSEYHRDGLAVH